jgi:hypothetical protein
MSLMCGPNKYPEDYQKAAEMNAHAFCWFLGRFWFFEERVYLEISEKPRITRENRKHHQEVVQWVWVLRVA